MLFEFDRDRLDEIEEIVKGCSLVGGLGFNTCVLRATEHHFGYKQKLHVVWHRKFGCRVFGVPLIVGPAGFDYCSVIGG